MSLRKHRPAIATTALAIIVIIVIIVGGAIGVSLPKSGKAASSSSTTAASATSSSSSAKGTSSSASSSASSVSSNSSGSILTPSPALFNFTIESAPSTILISPGLTLIYASIYFTPTPNQLEGVVAQNIGIGDELVDMNATVPSGLSIQFYGSNLTNTIYTEIDDGVNSNVDFTLSAAQGIAPGNYPISIEATSGTEAVNYNFTVQVVQYLVTLDYNVFQPHTMTVPVGTTVFWLNVDNNNDNQGDVIFTTINVLSPVLNPNPAYQSWSYTFTTPGTYTYYNSAVPGEESSATIVVTG